MHATIRTLALTAEWDTTKSMESAPKPAKGAAEFVTVWIPPFAWKSRLDTPWPQLDKS